MDAKNDLLEGLDDLTASMCKGYSVGEAAGMATNKYVKLLTGKLLWLNG